MTSSLSKYNLLINFKSLHFILVYKTILYIPNRVKFCPHKDSNLQFPAFAASVLQLELHGRDRTTPRLILKYLETIFL